MRKIVMVLMLATFLGCGHQPEPVRCNCQINDDGTLNFKAELADGSLMIRANGRTFIKQRMPDQSKVAYDNWRNMKSGRELWSKSLIRDLEACSLLYEWKRKALEKFFLGDTVDVRLSTDSLK